MKSKLKAIRCKVFHERYFPRKYKFQSRLFWLALDLNDLNSHLFFSLNRWNLLSFYEKDHIDYKSFVAENFNVDLKHLKFHKSLLLTQPRFVGYVFNPVSYFFFETNFGPCAIIEIGNTFNEKKPYFIGPECFHKDEKDQSTYKYISISVDKQFYISPFTSSKNKMEFYFYQLNFEDLSQFKIKIHDFRKENGLEVKAALEVLEQEFIHGFSVFKYFLLYPMQAFMVTIMIHFHALKLYLKRVPFFTKQEELNHQKGYQKWK